MDPFDVLKQRGHILEGGATNFNRTVTHSGANDDYDVASGPKRSLTARSDKKMVPRDYRMPVDLARSRRVGISLTICTECGATKDQAFCRHNPGCSAPGTFWQDTSGPLPAFSTPKSPNQEH